MTIQELGVKDLEHVVIKARQNTNLGAKVVEKGEPIIYFENLQIAMLTENSSIIAARGGLHNEARVVWEDRNDTVFQFSNGTINPISLNFLLEAKVLAKQEGLVVPYKEKCIVDDEGNVFLTYQQAENTKLFTYLYDYNNIQKRLYPAISTYTTAAGEDATKLSFSPELAGEVILCDYYFVYGKESISYSMSRERFSSSYLLEATFQLKDENEGLIRTGIITMPKIAILSNINLRLGERADPMVSTFRIIAMPENVKDASEEVCRITYLDEDITT